MRRLSSNLSIFFRLFLPLVYIVFFGSLVIGSFLITANDSPLISSSIFRYGMLSSYIIFVLIFSFSIMKLKRVDADENNILISNYFKTYKYTWDSIKKMTTINLLIFDIIYIHIHEKGKFGKKVFFLASRSLVKSFFSDYTQLFKYIDPNSTEVQE